MTNLTITIVLQKKSNPRRPPTTATHRPGKRWNCKCSQAYYFTYYRVKIGKRDYWVNAKMHKLYGETIYTIENEKPNDLMKGERPKIE